MYPDTCWHIWKRQIHFPTYSTHFSNPNTGPDMEHHSLGKTPAEACCFHSLCCPYEKPARLSKVQSSQRQKPKRPLTQSMLKVLQACVTLNGAVHSYDPLPSRVITKIPLGHAAFPKADGQSKENMKTGSREMAEQYILYFQCPINSSVWIQIQEKKSDGKSLW